MALRSYWNLVLKNRNCVYTSVDLCHVTSLGLTHHYGLWVTVRVIIRVIIVWCFISHDFDDCRNSDRTRPTLTPSRAKVRVQTSVVWNSFYSNYTVPSAVLIASCKTYSCTIEKHAAKSSEKSEARGGLTISCGGRAGMGLRHHDWRLERVPGPVTRSWGPPPGSTWAAPRPVSLEIVVGLQLILFRKGLKKIEHLLL